LARGAPEGIFVFLTGCAAFLHQLSLRQAKFPASEKMPHVLRSIRV
jgi:hypothetical protein